VTELCLTYLHVENHCLITGILVISCFFCRSPKPFAIFTGTHQFSLSGRKWIKSEPSHSTYFRLTLILSSHLEQVLQCFLVISGFFFLPFMPHAPPISCLHDLFVHITQGESEIQDDVLNLTRQFHAVFAVHNDMNKRR